MEERTDGTIEVVPYDDRWPALFDAELPLLSRALPCALSIEHIGSTSVPGLAAKPTIDILAVVPAIADALACVPELTAVGYHPRPDAWADVPGHEFFRKVRNGKRTHHLHVVEEASPEPDAYRLFRDFLRSDADARAHYERCKFELLARHGADRARYVEAKSLFVDDLMTAARAWRDRSPYINPT